MLSDGFGPGFNGPLMVVVDTRNSSDGKAAAGRVAEEIESIGVSAVVPPVFNKAGDTATITVIPKDRPSSHATEEVVHDIRDAGEDVRADTGAEVLVTGATAMNIDFSQKMNDALLPYLALVVGLAFLLLMLVFRSILVPLRRPWASCSRWSPRSVRSSRSSSGAGSARSSVSSRPVRS
ncbi:hypothetical protein SCALM49S_05435 [Streptomyces californicus]